MHKEGTREFRDVGSGMETAERFETAFEPRGAFAFARFGKASSRGRGFLEPQRRCRTPLRENRIDWFDGKHAQEVLVSVTATHFVYVHTDTHTSAGKVLIGIKNPWRPL